MNSAEFKDKFIGFVDVLGFKELVKAAEAGTGMPLAELLEMLKKLGSCEDQKEFERSGPIVCPSSTYIQRNLDFRVTQISDCVIVSSEVSPAGVINLVNHCWSAVMRLLTKGVMCRGYITRGLVYHTDTQVIGSGYEEAYSREAQVAAFKSEADERGTPFVEVDAAACDYVRDHGAPIVKEMFSRYVVEDGKVTVLFPFKRLAHAFTIVGFGYAFDQGKEKRFNQNMRKMIENLKERVVLFVDSANPNAVSKAKHYIAALDTQLDVCRRTDEMIDTLNLSFPSI